MSEPVTFQAAVYKVQTLVDRGLRLTLDLPEDATVEAAKLIQFQRFSVVVQVTIEPEE